MTFLGSGYANWVVTWTLDGSTKVLQTVHMLKQETGLSASGVNTKMRTFFTSASRPYAAANMFVGYTLAKTETYVNISGVVTYFLDETAIVGTKAGTSGTPVNTSILVKKNTGIVGRRYQGRHMIPNFIIPESEIAQTGIITPAGIATFQTPWTSALAAMTTDATLKSVLGHSTSEVVPTPYDSVTIQPKVGTMRRRIRGF